MTATPASSARAVPATTARTALLAIPQVAQLAPLARAWFPEAEWVVEPGRSAGRPSPVGARFRGMAAQEDAAPGQLRLTWAAHLEGPLSPSELEAAGISPSGKGAVFRLCVQPGSAAARRAGGAVHLGPVVPAQRAPGADDGAEPGATQPGAPQPSAPQPGAPEAPTVERADPDSAVELGVFSAVPVAPEVALGLVRAVIPSAEILSAPEPDEGIAPYAIAMPTQFDGSVELRFARAGELPVCLLELDWREYGPFAYRVQWVPPRELDLARDEQLVRIARARVRPVVARVTFALQRAAGGTVVDEDGFVLMHDELVARAVAM